MKLWIKRALALALIAAGAVLLFRHGKQLLDWPHLYPDLGEAGKENLVFLALTLFTLAMAWIAAAYLLLNCEKRIEHFLVPAAAFALLLFVCSLTMTKTVGTIPCTYTSALASCREDFDERDFRVDGRSLYPVEPKGELTAYARYEKEDVFAESLTRTYEQEDFISESARLQTLNVYVFRPPQDYREREILCYQVEQRGNLWQVLVVPKTKTVTYSHFRHTEGLPSFAPQPTEEATGESGQLTGDS